MKLIKFIAKFAQRKQIDPERAEMTLPTPVSLFIELGRLVGMLVFLGYAVLSARLLLRHWRTIVSLEVQGFRRLNALLDRATTSSNSTEETAGETTGRPGPAPRSVGTPGDGPDGPDIPSPGGGEDGSDKQQGDSGVWLAFLIIVVVCVLCAIFFLIWGPRWWRDWNRRVPLMLRVCASPRGFWRWLLCIWRYVLVILEFIVILLIWMIAFAYAILNVWGWIAIIAIEVLGLSEIEQDT